MRTSWTWPRRIQRCSSRRRWIRRRPDRRPLEDEAPGTHRPIGTSPTAAHLRPYGSQRGEFKVVEGNPTPSVAGSMRRGRTHLRPGRSHHGVEIAGDPRMTAKYAHVVDMAK